jgi:hypothetical protein
MQIWILFTLMQIWIRIWSLLLVKVMLVYGLQLHGFILSLLASIVSVHDPPRVHRF